MNRMFDTATNISTPLMLAGFVIAALFLIVRQILKKDLFPSLTRQLSSDIIKLIIERLFILSVIAIILGFSGFVLTIVTPSAAENQGLTPTLENTRQNVEQLLRSCEKAFQYARRDKDVSLMETCFENPSDAYAVLRFFEPPGSPHEIRLKLVRMAKLQQSIAEGTIVFKTVAVDSEKSREAHVKFKSTSNGWRLADSGFLQQQ